MSCFLNSYELTCLFSFALSHWTGNGGIGGSWTLVVGGIWLGLKRLLGGSLGLKLSHVCLLCVGFRQEHLLGEDCGDNGVRVT